MNIINALQVNRTHVSVWQVLYGAMLEMEQNLKQLELKGGSRGGGVLSTCATSHSTCIPRVVPQMGAGGVRVISLHYPADTDPSGGETAAIAIVELH